jgi:alpha-tubulin suppressor-like RCC1 family protein
MRNASILALGSLALLAAVGCQSTTDVPTAPAAEPSAQSVAAAIALQFREVSAGYDHSCGVTRDNIAYCWGGNYAGQLGTNEPFGWVGRPTPAPVVGTIRFRSVSAGAWFSCGLGTGFRAHCWGLNQDGAVGDGTTEDRRTPTPVAGDVRFRQVVSGGGQACGIGYYDSLAYCWGYNGYGQLGDRSTVNRLTPARVSGARRWRQLSAGLFHTCGITLDQRVYCWGQNRYGQLGDSTGVSRLWPVRVAAGALRFQQVSAGPEHTCAVSTAGKAFCWGNGRLGELGTGKTYLSFWPRPVAGGLSFTMVSAGGPHTCGKTILGGVYCWGGNNEGSLGDGTTTNRLTPVPVTGNLALVQVSAGGAHTCGTTVAGIGYSWGDNASGQLGDGTTTTRLRPVAIAAPK